MVGTAAEWCFVVECYELMFLWCIVCDIERVAAALNALGVSTRDMMSIFQTMKRAGALQAELVLN